MLTIIFGAGASFDALPDFPPGTTNRLDRLPLANGLFENRPILADALDRFPRCKPIVPYLRRTGASVEEQLERFLAESREFPDGKRQLAAVRYYIQSAIAQCGQEWNAASRGITNYDTLLDQVVRHKGSREPVLLVTFNYDLMIEQALIRRRRNISSISDYIDSQDYVLVKPHGSVNWGREIIGRHGRVPGHVDPWDIVNRNIEKIDEIQLSPNGYVLDWRLPPVISVADDDPMALFPAIAIPLQDSKTEFECPPAHLEVMKEHLRKTDRLLTIGWRARERHFLRLLREAKCTSPWVHAVGGGKEDAEATLKALKEGEISGPHEASGCSGFSDFVVSGEIEAFLKRGKIPVRR